MLERDYDIGDIVYSKKEGVNHQYEVTYVYPLEAGEKYFRLKRICGWDPNDFNNQAERFYAIEYFYHMPWIVERGVIFEKIRTFRPIVNPITGEINLKYNPLNVQEDYYLSIR